MTMENIVTVISTVGFPIATCLMCFWYISNLSKSMTEAINNNTLALTKLELKIEEIEGGVKNGGNNA